MKILLLTVTIMASIFVSKPANAIIGIAAEDRATAYIGLALMDISQVVIAERRHVRYRRGYRSVVYTTYRVVTLPALLLAGFVILGDEQTADFSGEISNELATSAKLTANERQAMMDSKEEINAVLDSVTAELVNLEGSKEQKTELAKNLWNEYGSMIDQDAINGMVKVLNVKK